jgi:hypothetical protein
VAPVMSSSEQLSSSGTATSLSDSPAQHPEAEISALVGRRVRKRFVGCGVHDGDVVSTQASNIQPFLHFPSCARRLIICQDRLGTKQCVV